MNKSVKERITDGRRNRDKLISGSDKTLLEIENRFCQLVRELIYRERLLTVLSGESPVRMRFRFKHKKRRYGLATTPYVYAEIKKDALRQNVYLGPLTELNEELIKRKLGAYANVISYSYKRNLGTIIGLANSIDNMFSRIYMLKMNDVSIGEAQADGIGIESYNDMFRGLLEFVQTQKQESHLRMKLIEAKLDHRFHLFNRVVRRRYMSLVVAWLHKERKDKLFFNPYDAEYRVVQGVAKVRRGVVGARNYTVSLKSFVEKQRPGKVRKHGKITWELINDCRLVRYRKFILEHQKEAAPLIEEWRNLNEKLQNMVKVIERIKGEHR